MTITKIPTVQELRQKGWKVRVNIFRKPTLSADPVPMVELRENHWTDKVEAKGGRVEVELLSPEGVETKGVATCNATDIFVRKVGRNLAIARALNIQPVAEAKYKVGDKVWVLKRSGVVRDVVTHVEQHNKFNEDSCEFETDFLYGFDHFFFWWPNLVSESEIGETKEELLEKLSANAKDLTGE